MQRENSKLEYKEKISNTFLKTVSAFANYGDGQIVFGIADDGTVVGVPNPVQACLDLENRINDSMSPVPQYQLSIDDATQTITLHVAQGPDKPYFYKHKAYRRSDSASVEVDRLELNRLVLAGSHINFEDLPSQQQTLQFGQLSRQLREKVGISRLSADILRTLGLYTDEGRYNQAAALLADKNTFAGVDVIRFGQTLDEIRERQQVRQVSVLQQFHDTMKFFRAHYCYEKITGETRQVVESVPEKAMREALANSLVHRTWDVAADIHIAMFADRLEITSPGGLPAGITEEEYLYHQISVLRNPKLANVFYRLGYIESFGTGIQRIRERYADSVAKPQFLVTTAAIKIILPVRGEQHIYHTDEQRVMQVMSKNILFSRAELEQMTGFDKAKLLRVLHNMLQQGTVQKIGKGRSTKYKSG